MASSGSISIEGLSPHRRGNRDLALQAPGEVRSIPAQAGEPATLAVTMSPSKVYPRTGGGTLSPR